MSTAARLTVGLALAGRCLDVAARSEIDALAAVTR
jgi:hypothetical protein